MVSWMLVMVAMAQIRGQPLMITSILSHMSRGVSTAIRVKERTTASGRCMLCSARAVGHEVPTAR